MREPRALRSLAAALVFGATLLAPVLAWAQTPVPGSTPPVSKPWTYYMSFPIVLGAAGLIGLVALSYVRLSPRFYGREEVKLPKPPPQYAGVNAPAVPAPVIAQPAPPPQEAPAQASPQQAAPAAQPSPPGASVPAAQPETQEAAGPAAPPPRVEEAPAAAPAAEASPAPAEAPPAEAPAPVPAAAPSAPADPNVPKGGDPETYRRVLEEQLAKGVDRRIAEGRAKSASIKAARPPGEGS